MRAASCLCCRCCRFVVVYKEHTVGMCFQTLDWSESNSYIFNKAVTWFSPGRKIGLDLPIRMEVVSQGQHLECVTYTSVNGACE